MPMDNLAVEQCNMVREALREWDTNLCCGGKRKESCFHDKTSIDKFLQGGLRPVPPGRASMHIHEVWRKCLQKIRPHSGAAETARLFEEFLKENQKKPAAKKKSSKKQKDPQDELSESPGASRD